MRSKVNMGGAALCMSIDRSNSIESIYISIHAKRTIGSVPACSSVGICECKRQLRELVSKSYMWHRTGSELVCKQY